jgi:hypothetical protein
VCERVVSVGSDLEMLGRASCKWEKTNNRSKIRLFARNYRVC